jgi:hypothetical protein
MFMSDFETTTDPDDCRVWAYGWMELFNKGNWKIGNNMNEFMQWCESVKADIYFHNLKFDGSFIVNWLLMNGFEWTNAKEARERTFTTIISKMGQWYMIDICYGFKQRGKRREKLHTVIYDSLKKLPFPVRSVAKAFNLPVEKGDIDYKAFRPVGHVITDEEIKYIYNDIYIVTCALEIQFKQGLEKMTVGSDAMGSFKAMMDKKIFARRFPVLDPEIDLNIRKAYRGGFTWVNDLFQGQMIGEGMVFDVTSLYPSVMYDRDLPYGVPIPFSGEYQHDNQYPLYIQHIRCEFEIKEGFIPTIQIKKNLRFKQNEYLKNSGGRVVDLYVSNVDFELIKEHYNLYDLEYLEGFKFKKKSGMFKEYIDYWIEVKEEASKTGNEAMRTLAKLMLNSLYGKFASSMDVTGKVPYLKEDGSNGFRLGEEETKDPVYTAMGVFITAYARDYTIRTAQSVFDRICYCDTDSIHITGLDVPEAIKDIVDPYKLGLWKHESSFKKAKYVRQKTYIEELYGKMVWNEKEGKEKFKECDPEESTCTKIDVKCAGMPESIKQYVTFENFEVGFSHSGKLLPKQVRGGVVLKDTDFTIK